MCTCWECRGTCTNGGGVRCASSALRHRKWLVHVPSSGDAQAARQEAMSLKQPSTNSTYSSRATHPQDVACRTRMGRVPVDGQ